MPESPREIFRQLSQERARNRQGEGPCTGDRPHCRENPREILRRIARGVVHEWVAAALARAGCRVRYVERFDYHPVWRITLARPWPHDAPRGRAFRRSVKNALRSVDDRVPVEDLDARVQGERLIVLFIWEALTGPGVLAIQPGRTDFLRRADGGRWDAWRV